MWDNEKLYNQLKIMHTPPVKYKNVYKVALCSRLVVFILQYLAVHFIPAHENDGFKFKREVDVENGSFLDKIVHEFFRGFTNWDGQYFLHIANHGYTHDNTMAFFPLFPMMVWACSSLVHIVTFPFLAFSSTVIVVGFLLNLYLFTKCAEILYRLTPYYDFGMENLSTIVVILFCYNPASIFFSAFYSETLFAFLTFRTSLELHRGNLLQALFFASLSTCCRSNGILNLGFIFLSVFLDIYQKRKHQMYYEVNFMDLMTIFLRGVLCLCGLIPFLLFQVFCYWRICKTEYVLPEKVPEFCIKTSPWPTLPYSYIQSSNWDVGLFKYFQIKQLPNFLLAAPVLTVLFSQCHRRIYDFGYRILKEKDFTYIPNAVACCHGLFLAAFCFLCIHVQVSTRMIFSSCPYLYMFIAQSIRADIARFRYSLAVDSMLTYALGYYTWFTVYFIVGAVLFSTGLPWT